MDLTILTFDQVYMLYLTFGLGFAGYLYIHGCVMLWLNPPIKQLGTHIIAQEIIYCKRPVREVVCRVQLPRDSIDEPEYMLHAKRALAGILAKEIVDDLETTIEEDRQYGDRTLVGVVRLLGKKKLI